VCSWLSGTDRQLDNICGWCMLWFSCGSVWLSLWLNSAFKIFRIVFEFLFPCFISIAVTIIWQMLSFKNLASLKNCLVYTKWMNSSFVTVSWLKRLVCFYDESWSISVGVSWWFLSLFLSEIEFILIKVVGFVLLSFGFVLVLGIWFCVSLSMLVL